MKFMCPNCGRQEEIILERKPRCSFCPVEMIPESDYSDCFMSPFIALRRMRTIRETYGTERARSDGQFKKEREAAATAFLALAYKELHQKEWWIEIAIDEPPDTRLHSVDQSAGYNVHLNCNVEVVDWEEHVEDIMDVIRQKCGKQYPRDYVLLVHARYVGKVVDLFKIIEEVKKIPSPFSEIWLIGAVERNHARVVRIAPPDVAFDLDVGAAMETASKQHPFLKRGIRGTEPGFYRIGITFLPIP